MRERYAPDVSSGVRPGVGPGPGFGPLRLIRALYGRFARLFHELGKFGVVGAVCYVVDVAIFNLCLVVWNIHWFSALVTSTVVAATLAFFGNRYWTWRDRERTALHREYGLYFGFNIVGLLISAAVLWLSHDLLGQVWPALQSPLADNISGKILGVGLASTFRFWAYRRFVFKTLAAPV
jgi:putative flippase GtrA